MRIVILIIMIVYSKVIHSDGEEHPPDDINDLFPIIHNSSSDLNNNITLDIGKVDVKRLAEKIGALNESVDEMSIIDARRQALNPYLMSNWYYQETTNHMAKQRTTDLMLQIIYMTRHILQEMEANPNFSQEDTGFKIGILYSKLLQMAEDMQVIFTMMYNKRYNYYQQKQHLQLHHRAVKLHTEFTYTWWVLIKIDQKYREINGERPGLPKSFVQDGGITDDEHIKIGFKMVSAIDLSRGQPVPHAEELHRILAANVMNYTDTHKGSLFEYLLNPEGNNSNNTENLDIKVLDADNLKKIVEMAKRRQARQWWWWGKKHESLTGNLHLIDRSLEQMQQSIYATRFRIMSTAPLRKQFGDNYSYKIALLVGSMNQIIMKMESYHAQMLEFPIKTHFLWYLILYEKSVACHVDVTYIVKRIFVLNSQHISQMSK